MNIFILVTALTYIHYLMEHSFFLLFFSLLFLSVFLLTTNIKKNGQTGNLLYPSGNQYIGQFYSDKREGTGIMHWNTMEEMYDGGWKAGLQDGTCVLKCSSNKDFVFLISTIKYI